MKKKISVVGIIIVVLAVGLLLYFRPLKLSDLIGENKKILVIYIDIGVNDGEAYMDSKSYNDITDEQKNNMISLFGEYHYNRTFGTVFSDGSLTGLGDELVQIFVYEGSVLVNTISISSNGSISVNDKSYKLKNADELIDNLSEIVNN